AGKRDESKRRFDSSRTSFIPKISTADLPVQVAQKRDQLHLAFVLKGLSPNLIGAGVKGGKQVQRSFAPVFMLGADRRLCLRR
ncbi:MAG: hypothetical protein AAFY26_25475, partial [Cyanobacteria bacterium J06638_22]